MYGFIAYFFIRRKYTENKNIAQCYFYHYFYMLFLYVLFSTYYIFIVQNLVQDFVQGLDMSNIILIFAKI